MEGETKCEHSDKRRAALRGVVGGGLTGGRQTAHRQSVADNIVDSFPTFILTVLTTFFFSDILYFTLYLFQFDNHPILLLILIKIKMGVRKTFLNTKIQE